jgi:hypothetical protein
MLLSRGLESSGKKRGRFLRRPKTPKEEENKEQLQEAHSLLPFPFGASSMPDSRSAVNQRVTKTGATSGSEFRAQCDEIGQ